MTCPLYCLNTSNAVAVFVLTRKFLSLLMSFWVWWGNGENGDLGTRSVLIFLSNFSAGRKKKWLGYLVVGFSNSLFFPFISFSFASEIFLLVHTVTMVISVHGHTAAKLASFVIYATFYALCLIIDYMTSFLSWHLFTVYLHRWLLLFKSSSCAHTILCYFFIAGRGKLKQRSK